MKLPNRLKVFANVVLCNNFHVQYGQTPSQGRYSKNIFEGSNYDTTKSVESLTRLEKCRRRHKDMALMELLYINPGN
jgi:hypothetical protein